MDVLGNSILWGTGILQADSILWGTSTVDSNTVLWGTSILWGTDKSAADPLAGELGDQIDGADSQAIDPGDPNGMASPPAGDPVDDQTVTADSPAPDGQP
jgi:hypothetical protein